MDTIPDEIQAPPPIDPAEAAIRQVVEDWFHDNDPLRVGIEAVAERAERVVTPMNHWTDWWLPALLGMAIGFLGGLITGGVS